MDLERAKQIKATAADSEFRYPYKGYVIHCLYDQYDYRKPVAVIYENGDILGAVPGEFTLDDAAYACEGYIDVNLGKGRTPADVIIGNVLVSREAPPARKVMTIREALNG
jgi:hypothetical protein